MPRSAYSWMRSATCRGLPTSAVPAPPRTRPTPAHRLGATSRPARGFVLSNLPPCSAAMRRWPIESIAANFFCGPGFLFRLAHDHVQADAELQLASELLGTAADVAHLLRDGRRRLAP